MKDLCLEDKDKDKEWLSEDDDKDLISKVKDL